MLEFPPALLSQSPSPHLTTPMILVDSREACLAEAGELIAAKIPASSLVELGEAVDLKGAPIAEFEQLGLRRNNMSLFKCVGIGAMDVAITALMVELAGQLGVGTVIPF